MLRAGETLTIKDRRWIRWRCTSDAIVRVRERDTLYAAPVDQQRATVSSCRATYAVRLLLSCGAAYVSANGYHMRHRESESGLCVDSAAAGNQGRATSTPSNQLQQ